MRVQDHLYEKHRYGIVNNALLGELVQRITTDLPDGNLSMVKRGILAGGSKAELVDAVGLSSWTTSISQLYAQAQVELRKEFVPYFGAIWFDRWTVIPECRSHTIEEAADMLLWPTVDYVEKPAGTTFCDLLALVSFDYVCAVIECLPDCKFKASEIAFLVGNAVDSRQNQWLVRNTLLAKFNFTAWDAIKFQRRFFTWPQVVKLTNGDWQAAQVEYSALAKAFQRAVDKVKEAANGAS